jgi:cyclase
MNQREKIERVADGVWVGIPAPGEGAMGAVIGTGGMVVIDTTSYNLFAARFLEQVSAAEGRDDWRHLVVSHRHFDHFGGADGIHAPMIAHRLTRAALLGYTPQWLRHNLATWTEQGLIIPELLRDPTIVIPQITFDSVLELHLGNLEVQVIHVGGHTTDQSVVYVAERRLLFASDNIFHERRPFTGHGDLVAWISALDRIRTELPIDTVVPGHGPVGGPALIDAQKLQLQDLLATSIQEAG